MKFETFLNDVIAPMFPGLTIQGSNHQAGRISKTLVAFKPGAIQLVVKETISSQEVFKLSRQQPFDQTDKALIENLVTSYGEVKAQAEPYLSQLEETITRNAIAKSVAGAQGDQQKVIADALQTFSSWATQTYEGERVSSGVIITTDVTVDDEAASFEEFVKEDFSKALSDGVDSWWVVGSDGTMMGFETSATTSTPIGDKFYPLRYQPIAVRASGTKVGIALNRNGEILVFAKQRLRFAKRRGEWIHFAHSSVIKQMSMGGAGSVALRRAIYESCLDASFARSGACIGLLRQSEVTPLTDDEIVAVDDRLENTEKLKPLAAGILVSGRRFHKIDRAIRKELMNLDGALVLRPNGEVYAAGAILKLGPIDLGNQGGRSAAAKTLCHFGLGIKVSEDGMISGYKKETGDSRAAFKVG